MIVVRGGGLAGSAAAITAKQHGQEVLVVERSKFPKHKVCGEFLSPEALPLLNQLGIGLPEAARIRRVRLRFTRAEKLFSLSEPALGVSRYLLDDRLLAQARTLGASVAPEGPAALIIASGRHGQATRGRRLFGFKTHLKGAPNDTVELYFFSGGYVGVSQIENSVTNICGILPEDVLAPYDFDIDHLLGQFQPLQERLSRTEKLFPWLKTGPLVFSRAPAGDRYLCGDALSFVDPFTGSGMLAALATGIRAGVAAVRGEAVAAYLKDCSGFLSQPFALSSVLRAALHTKFAESLAPFIPGPLFYCLTRPRLGT